MDKSSRTMVKYIRSMKFNSNPCLFKNFYPGYLKHAGCTRIEAAACIRYLEKTGLIRYHFDAAGNPVGFYPEHKLYHIIRFDFEEKWQNYVIPAVVTVLTNAMLYASKWLLPRILQWLRDFF